MLIDVHAHFLHDRDPARRLARAQRQPAPRRRARRDHHPRRLDPRELGTHVAHLLSRRRPTSATATTRCSRCSAQHPARIRGYVAVNPNYTDAGARARSSAACDAGMIGIKLAASRRANDPLLDPDLPAGRGARRSRAASHLAASARASRPGQEASDARELGALAARHPARAVSSWRTSAAAATGCTRCAAVRALANVYVDLSGSGVDGGMLEACLDAVGVERLLWGCDLTIETGWAKLRYLEHLLPPPSWSGALAQRRADLSRPARSRPTDAHRRQRLPRRVSLPPGAGHVARGACSRPWTASASTRRGSPTCPACSGAIRPRATTGCSRPPRGEPRLRPVPAVHPGLADWRGELSRAAAAGVARRARRSHVLRHRSRRRRDARAGRGVRRGRLAAAAGGAARGWPPAAPQRPRRRASRGGRARADPERPARPAARHPRRPAVHRGGALRLDARGGRRGSGGTSAGSGARRRTTSQTAARHGRRRALRASAPAQPLRIPENAGAKLDLLDLPPEDRAAIETRQRRGPRAGARPDGLATSAGALPDHVSDSGAAAVRRRQRSSVR